MTLYTVFPIGEKRRVRLSFSFTSTAFYVAFSLNEIHDVTAMVWRRTRVDRMSRRLCVHAVLCIYCTRKSITAHTRWLIRSRFVHARAPRDADGIQNVYVCIRRKFDQHEIMRTGREKPQNGIFLAVIYTRIIIAFYQDGV